MVRPAYDELAKSVGPPFQPQQQHQQQLQQQQPTQMQPAYSPFQQHPNQMQQLQQKQVQQQHQQQQRPNQMQPVNHEFLRSDFPANSQELSRTRTEQGSELLNKKDLTLIAAIDQRTVLRGLVREYIDSKRGILEIFQVGHGGSLLSEPVAGNAKLG